eukprot:gnl/TRDRNA2_/TRDRNA2_94402_c0_seq1.p1 gnl/TRDRNA2_/TRDRNA2_94402_c0~~gnl/TRDRNA2_/TRDRNA2_94402_c0_seq1.p1  ORF type:complete len:215 (-),score=33.28 gnl/TRDRNA2_/TRDRNA2_94402_c0_seq1:237-881(-)
MGKLRGQHIKKGDWFCPSCGDLQFMKNAECRKCGAAKPEGEAAVQALLPGDWVCTGCGDLVFAKNTECRMCKTPKPDDLPEPDYTAGPALKRPRTKPKKTGPVSSENVNAKTELMAFCQRTIARSMQKDDIVYTTNRVGDAWQSICKLNCIGEEPEYTGELCEGAKAAAEQSAALVALEAQAQTNPDLLEAVERVKASTHKPAGVPKPPEVGTT